MMPIDFLIRQPLARQVGWVLVHFLWQGAAIAGLLRLTLEALRGRSANARYLAACVAMALLAAAPVATFILLPSAEPVAKRASAARPLADAALPAAGRIAPGRIDDAGTDAEPIRARGGVADPSASTRPGAGARPPTPRASLPTRTARAHAIVGWRESVRTRVEPALPWCVAAWLAGVVLLSIWHLAAWGKVRRLRTSGTGPAGDALQAASRRLAGALGIHRPVRLLESVKAAAPMVVGWLRPVILLPVSAATGLASEQIEAILAHELAHIRRHDYFVNLLQSVMETLLFYHPAVWWVSRRMRVEREHCCDDMALRVCPDRRTYAEALGRVAELSRRTPRQAAAATGGAMLCRIRRVLGLPETRAGRATWLAAFLVAVALAAGGAVIHGHATTARAGSGPAGLAFGKAPAAAPADNEAAGQVRTVADVLEALKTELVGMGPRYPQLAGAKEAQISPQGLKYVHNCQPLPKGGYDDTGPNAVAIGIEVMRLPKTRERADNVPGQPPPYRWTALGLTGQTILHLGPDSAPDLPSRLKQVLARHVALIDRLDGQALGDTPENRKAASEAAGGRPEAGTAPERPTPGVGGGAPAAAKVDEDFYRGLYARYKAQILAAVKAGDKEEVARLTDAFNASIGGRLLYVRVSFIDAPDRITALLNKPFGGRRVPLPNLHYAFSAQPHVTRHDDKGGAYVLVETNKLPGGGYADYADGIYITMAVQLARSGDIVVGLPVKPQTGPATAPAAIGPQARARADALKAHIDNFRLSIWLADANITEHHNVMLHVAGTAPEPLCPFCGARKWPHRLFSARIDANRAARIVDHLAAEGFLDRCMNVHGMPMEPIGFPGLVLEAFGPDKTELFEELHRPGLMLLRLDRLRKVLDGDAATVMDNLLAAIEPRRRQWEKAAEEADRALRAAADKTRAGHPDGGEPMWRALAGLLKTGMTVRQMKTVLPPAAPGPDGMPHEVAILDGARFTITYPLDGAWGVQAYGTAVGRDQDWWVLSSPPRVKPRKDLPAVTTQPAGKRAPGQAAEEVVELVLGLWPKGAFQDGKDHLKIAVRNRGLRKIPSAESMRILMDGRLHLRGPDGSETLRSLGGWRGRPAPDIARGESAAHCINTAVDELFTFDRPGRYLLWWTSGPARSNTLVFEKGDKGLRLTDDRESIVAPPARAGAPAATVEQTIEARIAGLIAQLDSDKHAEREAAQKALVAIGRPAIRALEAAAGDRKNTERAARAQAALRQIQERFALNKESWRNRWERMSVSFRLTTPSGRDGSMGLDIDPDGKATADLWDPRREASIRYESVLSREDLDATAIRLGRQRPWELPEAPNPPLAAGGKIALTITVEDRSIHVEQPWPPPRDLPRTSENEQTLSALMAIRNEMTHLIEVVRRDAAIRAQGGTTERVREGEPTPSVEPGGERTAVRKVLDLLDLPWQTKLTDEDLDKAAASIRGQADPAVEAILKQYGATNNNSFRHRAVEVFQRLGTAKARAALLDIALARTVDRLPSSHAWAARAYLEIIPDKADARDLLASDEPSVLNPALLAMKGLPVDEPLLKRIGQIVQRKADHPADWSALRLAAADVVSADPRPVLLAERVDLVLTVLRDVAGMPEKDKTGFHSSMTYAEIAYSTLLRILREMPAEAGPLLKKASADRGGAERDIVIVACASRGDATVRKDIHAILGDDQAGLRRAWAARALGVIGTAEDLPLLKRLAETDPLAREMGGDVGPPGFRQAKFYPVRDAAKEALRAVEAEAAPAATQPATRPAKGPSTLPADTS